MPLFSRGFVRRRAISLATSLSLTATSFALAQDPKHDSNARMVKDKNERQFLFGSDLAISNMTRSILMKPTGDIDRDFVDVMVPQHQGAVDMARAEISYGHSAVLRQLAEKIVSEQKQEISIMRHAVPSAPESRPSTSADVTSYAPN